MGCATLSFEDVCKELYIQKIKRTEPLNELKISPNRFRCRKLKQHKGNRAEWGLAKCLGWDNPRGFTTKDLKLISILRG